MVYQGPPKALSLEGHVGFLRVQTLSEPRTPKCQECLLSFALVFLAGL